MAPSSGGVPAALASAEFVFVCEDASIHPLSQLYQGPYRVFSRLDKLINCSHWKLVSKGIQSRLIASNLSLVLSLILSSLLGVAGLLEPVLGLELQFLVLFLLWVPS